MGAQQTAGAGAAQRPPATGPMGGMQRPMGGAQIPPGLKAQYAAALGGRGAPQPMPMPGGGMRTMEVRPGDQPNDPMAALRGLGIQSGPAIDPNLRMPSQPGAAPLGPNNPYGAGPAQRPDMSDPRFRGLDGYTGPAAPSQPYQGTMAPGLQQLQQQMQGLGQRAAPASTPQAPQSFPVPGYQSPLAGMTPPPGTTGQPANPIEAARAQMARMMAGQRPPGT